MNKQSINVLIVDDEPIARDILETYLKQASGFELAGKCRNAVEAFKALSLGQVDLILLDINMPEISGVDLIRTLKNPPLVIFTTAYPDYAVESYELDIVDYLLKPISQERFQKALAKAAKLLGQATAPDAAAPAAPEAEREMFVRSEGKWIKIDITQLWFVEGLKDYVKLYASTGKIVVRSTMKNFEEQLAAYPNFLRVHKSFIVNTDHISEADGNFVKVKDQLISVGNTYKEDVYKLLKSSRLI
jgi:DNA-binding LytR/AlgR family response regulator